MKKDTSSGQWVGTTYTRSAPTYSPVVQFITVEGRTVEFTSAVGTSRSPNIGSTVPVRYRPNDPEQAEIDRATTWLLPAAFGLVGGLGLLVAAVIVFSSPRPAPSTGRLGTGRLAHRSVRPHPGSPCRSPPVPNGPMSAAVFNRYWGDPASLHFVRGYDVAYDSNNTSATIDVTLFQFATPADAAAFKADWVPAGPVKSSADPVIPGADGYNSTSPYQGFYDHGVIATKGNLAFVIDELTGSAAPVRLVETMARQQYAAL